MCGGAEGAGVFKSVNMVLDVDGNQKAYQGRGCCVELMGCFSAVAGLKYPSQQGWWAGVLRNAWWL